MALKLTLTQYGTAQLHNGRALLWASDTDDEFKDEFDNDFLEMEDVEDIQDFLIEKGTITESQADEMEVYEESLDGEDWESLDEEDDNET